MLSIWYGSTNIFIDSIKLIWLVWSQNSDFKIWHPTKKLGTVLKKETLSLKHLYWKQLYWHWNKYWHWKKKLIKIIQIRKSYHYILLGFFFVVSLFFQWQIFLQCEVFFQCHWFSVSTFCHCFASRGRGLRGGASRAWFAYYLRREWQQPAGRRGWTVQPQYTILGPVCWPSLGNSPTTSRTFLQALSWCIQVSVYLLYMECGSSTLAPSTEH